MKNKKYWKKITRLVTILFFTAIFLSVIYLMNYVQNLLYSDVKINLTEVVTQNKDVITSKLMLEVNNLESTANQLVDRMKSSGGRVDEERLKQVYREYCGQNESDNLFIATKDGQAIFSDGKTIDISGRNYFRYAIEGKQNISDRTVSRHTGEDIFVISVPLRYNDEIVGTVQHPYSPEEMYDLCSISLFSSQGYMYIINGEGYILISSRNQEYSRETENYFRMLYAQGDQDASRNLEKDVKNNSSGFMETTIDGVKTFSAYTSIEEIHDWYLISSVPTNAVSPNANIVIKMFYCILLMVVIIFALSSLYFLAYKNRQQANLERIAFVDTVTKGNTYNKFIVDLHAALKDNPGKQYYLLKFDIDNFKYINNFYGFDYGDKILFRINEEVGKKLRPGEMIARISSDHFVVLLENADMDRLNDMLDSWKDENGGVLVYFSAGLYSLTDPEESVNLMVDKASTAAQASKGALQKKVTVYSEKFDQKMIHNEQMKRAVKQGLDNHEMIPFFQPKVNINTGELVGAEALVRWRTGDGKLIPPMDFIPLCENTGMVVELDMIVFEKVLQFLKQALEEGVTCVPISVNFSRLHLLDKDFLDKVVDRLEYYGVPPHLIELELTESVMFDNHEIISEFIESLHKKKLLISMDDFGSGYSSLNMLKDVPIDVLKIDKEFLKDTKDKDRRNIIFSTIAQMADRLNIKVVVEGVENLENVELMKEFGCYIAQGYYFAKPMDQEKFEEIFRRGIIC